LQNFDCKKQKRKTKKTDKKQKKKTEVMFYNKKILVRLLFMILRLLGKI